MNVERLLFEVMEYVENEGIITDVSDLILEYNNGVKVVSVIRP